MKTCKACGEEIKEKAYLCTKCGTYQQPSRAILHATSMPVVVTVLLALFAYGYNNHSKWWPSEAIEVHEFNSVAGIPILNTGDSDVLLIDCQKKCDTLNESRYIPIYQLLKAHSIYSLHQNAESESTFVSGKSDQEWNEYLAELKQRQLYPELAYFSTNNSVFPMLAPHYGGKLNALDATIQINYFSLRDRTPRQLLLPSKALIWLPKLEIHPPQ